MLLPQLAQAAEITDLDHFLKDDRWVIEQKLDGNRLLLMSPDMDMPPTALTRAGTIYSKRLPKSIVDYRFPTGEWILDGELVGDTYWVFDLLKIPSGGSGSGDLTCTPLSSRRVMLEQLLQVIRHPFRIVPQAQTADEKIALAARSLQDNFEGLLLKNAMSKYAPGARNSDWLKLKYVVTADVVVLAVRDDGKESLKLGLYHGGVMTEVGRCSLIGKEKRGKVSVGDVIEVRYLYTGAGGRLYQPTMLRIRNDKLATDCDTAQLKMVNKAVLETL
jgi:bifunctional non-homologous end joining protein LigD